MATVPPGSPESPTKPGDWRHRLEVVVETMREMSLHTDPEAMVRDYSKRMRSLIQFDRSVSISRRDLTWPRIRITRDSTWTERVNPWLQKDKLPIVEGGKLAELIYSNRPHLIDDLVLEPDDPGASYFGDNRSIMAVPHFDRGESLNMVLHMRRGARGFDPEKFPEFVQMSTLFGRATHNLVLSSRLQEAYEALDRELAVVADMQRSLLPARLPVIPNVNLAASYETSRRAGGDYYDAFPLPGGKWGLLIADVSGHGTPAAVVMAIMHAVAHSYPGPAGPPGAMMDYLNSTLATRYTANSGTFVTAFYGVMDPAKRTLTYSGAGHNPPRIRRFKDPTVRGLDEARSLPLGINVGERYGEHTLQLGTGDVVVFYTDGITEAWSPTNEMFGVSLLDEVLADRAGKLPDPPQADSVVSLILRAVGSFTAGRPADDDRTIVAAVVG